VKVIRRRRTQLDAVSNSNRLVYLRVEKKHQNAFGGQFPYRGACASAGPIWMRGGTKNARRRDGKGGTEGNGMRVWRRERKEGC